MKTAHTVMKGKHTLTCKKCSRQFKSFDPDAEYCDKHHYLKPRDVDKKKDMVVTQTYEERLAKHREYKRERRLKAGMKPLGTTTERKPKVKKERKVTSAIILPVTTIRKVTPKTHEPPKIWYQLDKRTRIGFVDEGQMEAWKKRHGISPVGGSE